MIRQGFPSQAIAPGTQVMVERRGYRHYGIAADPGRVIHYAGLIRYPHGLVEEIPLSAFARGRELIVGPPPIGGDDILRRARSRLGEASYDLFTNNCEHFSNWCQTGQHRSRQAEALNWSTTVLIRVIQGLCTWPFHARPTKV